MTSNYLRSSFVTNESITMLKPGWKSFSFVLAVISWRWCTSRPGTTETFRGKNVVVCGGSTGIGEQLAYKYCEQGANVLVVARREWALKNVVENCSRLGASSAGYMIADLRGGSNGSRQLLQESLQRFGKIDVLVLNHVLFEVKRWQADQSYNEVATAFNVNVLSYIDLTTLFLPSLKASNGRLLVISSGLGLVTYPYFALYCASKHALHGFFNALRQDVVLEGNKMSITMSVLGAIATDNAIRIAGRNPVAGKDGWTRLSPVDAAKVTVEASLHRERQIYFPNFLKLHEIGSTHFPDLTEWLIRYVYNLEK